MYDFSEEELLILNTAREFALNRLTTVQREIDEQARWPEKTLKEMAELGLFGVIIPEKFGGFFKSYQLYYAVIKELAAVCATHALTLISHSFSSHLIKEYGHQEQKEKYLPSLASGEYLGAIALTEPEAGSDLSATKTTAKLCDNGYLLDGHKQFITNGSKANVVVVLTETDAKNSVFNKSLFIVEQPCEGFTSGKSEKKMGFRGSDTCELFFDNVLLSKNDLLGKKGQGMLQIMESIQVSRLATASLAFGIAEKAHKEAILYSKQRKQFGKSIKEFQNIQEYLADNETELECARLLLKNAALKLDKGDEMTTYSAMAKYYCTETALRIVNKSLQIHGAYGYTKDFNIERHYRDIRLCSIIEGTSEIQRMIIAQNL
jgi:butyryl-CoA dehydrogenase